MSWASRRQLLFIAAIGVIAILASVPVAISLYPKASCTDGKQNQNETGVDCGGICKVICQNTALPISVSWVRPFVITPGVASVVAYVTNPNVSLGAKEVPYLFRLYDANNILVAERKGTTTILPGTDFPIFEGGVVTGNRTPVRALFQFSAAPFWQKATRVELLVHDTELSDPLHSPRLVSSVRNDNLVPFKAIETVALLYDGEGNAIASSGTVIDSLSKGAETQVVFTWPLPFAKTPSRTEVYPKVFSF